MLTDTVLTEAKPISLSEEQLAEMYGLAHPLRLCFVF
jgi:hypothetical protein